MNVRRTVALALVLASLHSPRAHAGPEPESPGERAARHFAAKEWDAAIEALSDAYALDPDPDYLYARAQAERFRGDCAAAITYYRRFLASSPPPRQRDDTARNIAICDQQRVPPPRVDATAVAPVSRETPPPPAPRDVAGTVLVTLGAVGTLAGAAVWIAGSRLRARAPQLAHEGDYERTAARGRALTGAGIGITSAAAVTLLAGIIRYAVVVRRARAQ